MTGRAISEIVKDMDFRWIFGERYIYNKTRDLMNIKNIGAYYLSGCRK